MTTAIILGAVLCVIAFAVILRLSVWGLRSTESSDGLHRADRERRLERGEQRDRLAA